MNEDIIKEFIDKTAIALEAIGKVLSEHDNKINSNVYYIRNLQPILKNIIDSIEDNRISIDILDKKLEGMREDISKFVDHYYGR